MFLPISCHPRLHPLGPLVAIGFLLVGTACVGPVTHVDLGSIANVAACPDLTAAQTRVIPLAKDQAFPKALDVLLDMGFQIRCASQESGQVNVARTWPDPSGTTLSLEATLLFRAEGPGATRLRMAAIGSWKFISVGGPKSADADVSGMAATDDPAGYRQFLDRLVTEISQTVK